MAPNVATRRHLATEGKAQAVSRPGAPRGSYPTDTKGRAVAAKGYAKKAVEAGRMSAATEKSIDARANHELGKGGGSAARELGKRLNARDKK